MSPPIRLPFQLSAHAREDEINDDSSKWARGAKAQGGAAATSCFSGRSRNHQRSRPDGAKRNCRSLFEGKSRRSRSRREARGHKTELRTS